jgi:hypothetical protein
MMLMGAYKPLLLAARFGDWINKPCVASKNHKHYCILDLNKMNAVLFFRLSWEMGSRTYPRELKHTLVAILFDSPPSEQLPRCNRGPPPVGPIIQRRNLLPPTSVFHFIALLLPLFSSAAHLYFTERILALRAIFPLSSKGECFDIKLDEWCARGFLKKIFFFFDRSHDPWAHIWNWALIVSLGHDVRAVFFFFWCFHLVQCWREYGVISFFFFHILHGYLMQCLGTLGTQMRTLLLPLTFPATITSPLYTLQELRTFIEFEYTWMCYQRCLKTPSPFVKSIIRSYVEWIQTICLDTS